MQLSPDSQVPLPQTGPQVGHELHPPKPPHVHEPVAQVRVRVWFAQPPGHARVSVSTMPGVHSPLVPPLHVPNAPHAPHEHVAPQVRERLFVPVPHAPQEPLSVSIAPTAHSPSSVQAQAPQLQVMSHVRACVPQRPHIPPICTSPIEHGPPPTQVPSSRQTPPSQTCRCVPQCIHGTVRGATPSVQSQLVGAVHAAHVPSVQRSTPSAHAELHGRSAIRPTLALESSQSTSLVTPSMSTSSDTTQPSSRHA